MKLAYVHPLDLIEVNKGGRRVYGKVVEICDGVVQFEPLCRGISYRHATAREIVGHWLKTGRRGLNSGDGPERPNRRRYHARSCWGFTRKRAAGGAGGVPGRRR